MANNCVTAKRAYDNKIAIEMTSSTWDFLKSIKVSLKTSLPPHEARALAASIVQCAEEAEAKIAKEQAAERRREKWRQREIAAGRMVEMSSSDVFARRRVGGAT